MGIIVFKSVGFLAILLVAAAGSWVALSLSKARNSARFFNLGNAFAGGVFLGAGLLHMLADAEEGFSDMLGDVDFPWAEFVCAIGFLFILFLERVLIGGHHHDVASPADGHTMRKTYPYVLTLVLSIHSLIAGIALGTEGTLTRASIILLAVLAHKGSAAFALGVSLLRAAVPRRHIYAILTLFAFMTPIGILLGLGLTAALSGKAESGFAAVFDALAGGTFLYVAILDIFGEEFEEHADRATKFVLAIAGLVLMAVLAIFV